MELSDREGGWTPQCYDPLTEHTVAWRKLPHWSQPGTLTFITWRTWDSMPAVVVHRWLAERDDWLRRHGVDAARPGWELLLNDWPLPQRQAFRRFVSGRWGEHLDQLHGTCPLRRPELAGIVGQSLQHGGGAARGSVVQGLTTEREEYYLSDFVVMPNHVHVLAAFRTEEAMLRQCEAWKHFTAKDQPGFGPFRAVLGAGRLRPSRALTRGVRTHPPLHRPESECRETISRRISPL